MTACQRRKSAAPRNREVSVKIEYAHESDVSAHEFRAILVASELAQRRPVGDLARLERMLRASDIVVTARDEGHLVGISRAITDYSYCCYLSDLGVAIPYQRLGIGTRLIEETRSAAGETTSLIVVAAPAAESYYPKIGMDSLKSAWIIRRAR